MRKVSCVIPAFNEAPRLQGVLEAVTGHSGIAEIIVVDDGSTDGTSEIARSFPITLITLQKNEGKSKALARGIEAAREDLLLLLDADLTGLMKADITALLKPVIEGDVEVSISLRKNAPRLWHRIGIDYLSGERVLPRTLLAPHISVIKTLPGFGVEVYINTLIIHERCSLQVVKWPNVESPYKHMKHGIARGVAQDVLMLIAIMQVIGIGGPLRQIKAMKALFPSSALSLSFVIPAHNEEALLARCLDSLASLQSHHSFEVIVVDNASADRTREVATQFPFVRLIQEPHKGLTRARQAGFNAAQGTLIANIDADTVVPPGWIETVEKAFKKKEYLVAISGPFYYYDLSTLERFLVTIFYAFGYGVYVISHFVFGVGAMLQGGNFVVRRSTIEAIGGFDTSIAFYGEDTDIARRLAAHGRVLWTWNLPIHASGRRIRAEGLFTTGFRYALNFFSILLLKRPVTKKYSDIRSTPSATPDSQ